MSEQIVILVIIITSTVSVLWWFNRSSLLVLGLRPTKSRTLDFGFGFLVSAIACIFSFYAIAIVSESTLILNPDFTINAFFTSTLWMTGSVLIEELLFRGALLYISIKKIGVKRACVLSAVAFGIYHWFSYGIFGDVAQMIYIFILTGIGGLLFAYAYALTRSLYLPIGLHLGWNLIAVVIFSQGPLGDQMLIARDGHPIGALWTIIFFVYQIGVLPLATWFYLRNLKTMIIMEHQA